MEATEEDQMAENGKSDFILDKEAKPSFVRSATNQETNVTIEYKVRTPSGTVQRMQAKPIAIRTKRRTVEGRKLVYGSLPNNLLSVNAVVKNIGAVVFEKPVRRCYQSTYNR